MKAGEAITASLPDRQLILRLAKILPADPANAAAKGRLTHDLNEDTRKEISSEYIKYLRVLFPVTLKPDAIDSVVQGGG